MNDPLVMQPGSSAVFFAMLDEEIHVDITIEAKGGSVKAHRCVLACISPVFGAMFRHEMQEQQTSVVYLPDMSLEAVKLFLQAVYCGFDMFNEEDEQSLKLHWEEMFEACHKYEVPFLDACAAFMKRTLTVDNCWNYLAKAESWDPPAHPALRKVCTKYIHLNCREVTNAAAFSDATHKYPGIVVQVMRFVVSCLKNTR